jgi:hypothetical protein
MDHVQPCSYSLRKLETYIYALCNHKFTLGDKYQIWMVAWKAWKKNAQEKKTVSLCTCALFLVRPRRGRWARASSHPPHQCRSSAATFCVCAPHSLLETGHNSKKKPSDQPHHLGCRRNARQIRSSGQSCYLWGWGVNHELVVGDLDGTEGVALLTEASGDQVGQRWPE